MLGKKLFSKGSSEKEEKRKEKDKDDKSASQNNKFSKTERDILIQIFHFLISQCEE
jgi:hypothetical protein